MKKDVIVKESKIQGKGVFANKDFKKGETVLKWNLSIKLTKEHADKLPEKEKHYLYLIKKGKYLLHQPPSRFVNHSCNPNTKVENYCDVALREIKKGEEITSHYTKKDVVDFEAKCKCKSRNCKEIIKID